MKKTAAVFLMVISGTLYAQGDSWDAKESKELSLTVPGGQERASVVTKMTAEKRCPPADSWDKPLPEQDWNVLELGFAVDLPLKGPSETEPKLYSRYTCNGPIDKPMAGR